MQISHPAALVSSTELGPDQQTQHIHWARVLTSLSVLLTASLSIHFHSAVLCFKNPYNCGLFCIWPLYSPHLHSTHTHTQGDAAVHVLIQREMAFCLCCSPSQKVTQAYPYRIKPWPLL